MENIDIDIDIDKEILENIDIDKISNRLEFGISNRAILLSTPLYSFGYRHVGNFQVVGYSII